MADLTVVRTELANPDQIAAGAVAAAGGGDRFNPGSNSPVFIYVANGHSSPQSVIIDDPTSVAPEQATASNPDVTIAVTNAQNRVIPIRNPQRFRDANGWINLTYTGVVSLTIKVFT